MDRPTWRIIQCAIVPLKSAIYHGFSRTFEVKKKSAHGALSGTDAATVEVATSTNETRCTGNCIVQLCDMSGESYE